MHDTDLKCGDVGCVGITADTNTTKPLRTHGHASLFVGKNRP